MDLEGDEITTSLSKGCFLFKPKHGASPRKTKRRNKSNTELSAVDFLQSFSEENSEDKTERFLTLTKCWACLHSEIQKVQSNLNEKIFTELLQFVEKVCSNAHSSATAKVWNTEISTAVLVTGVNLPDHNVIFTSFVDQLKENITPFAVQLQSKDCINLKYMLKTAFDEVFKCLNPQEDSDSSEFSDCNSEDYDNDDDDDDDRTAKNKKRRSRNKSVFKDYTFHELIGWYEENAGVSLNSGNAGLQDVKKQPIVFVLEDFERFAPTVLQDFILICSEYVQRIPIVLLFGVATTVSVIHNFLPHAVSTRLSIEKFQAQPSLVCLTEVVDQVLISNRHAFKLGPDVSRLLYEHFLYHDFSIKNFVRALKFCVMEHFSNSSVSVLCTKDEDFIREYIQSIHPKLLVRLKELGSVERFIDRKSKTEQTKLHSDSKYIKNVLFELVSELRVHENTFYPVVKCLYVCTFKLPGFPFGKRLRDTYEYSMCAENITKEKKFKMSMMLVRMLSRNELLLILEKCTEIIENVITNEGCQVLKENLDMIVAFIPRFDELDNPPPNTTPGSQKSSTSSDTTTKVKTPTLYKNRYEMMEKMKSAVKEKRQENPFEKLRNEIVDCLEKLFREYLYSPMFMPLHEIFYYNDINTVRKRINGTPRMAHQKALSDPHSYLHCVCCKNNSLEIRKTQPDICTLYKLHLESGKLINLYDWLQAYMTIIDPTVADPDKKKSKAKKKVESQLQARFIRGVSELQFLGFIKSTKRKTDHVARLTWGGC